MSLVQEEFLIRWNYQFPADRWYRKKYEIGLFSPEHLELSQIDIALEYYEEKMFEKLAEEGGKMIDKEKRYDSGELFLDLIPVLSTQQEEDLFSKIKPDQFSKIQFANEEKE